MKFKATIALGLATAMLAGCGLRQPLRPAEGASMPQAPALADRALTTDELLSVSSEMRPLRVDEPLTRSERRPIDPFDLAPPDADGTSEGASELEERPAPAPADPPQ